MTILEDFTTGTSQSLSALTGWYAAAGTLWVDATNDEAQMDPNQGSGFSRLNGNNSETLNDDQYCQGTYVGAGGGTNTIGPAVRVNNTGDGYGFVANGGQSGLIRWDNGNDTFIDFGSSVADGSLLYLEAVGTAILGQDDGVDKVNATDSTYSSGDAGLNGQGNDTATVAAFDDLEADSLGGITGTGSFAVPATTMSATGVVGHTGTGSFAVPTTTLSASGTVGHTGSAAFAVDPPTLAASGTVGHTGTGDFVVPAPTMDASGTVTGGITGTGSFAIPAPAMSASGVVGHTGSAAFSVPAPALSGSGVVGHTGTAAFSVPAPTMSSSGTTSAISYWILDTVGVIRAPGRLVVGPSDLSADYPYGGVEVGKTKLCVVHPVGRSFRIESEGLGGTSDILEGPSEHVFSCFLRGWDDNAIEQLLSANFVAGTTSQHATYVAPGAVVAGSSAFDRAVVMLFVPDDPVHVPAIIIYRGIPFLPDDARVAFDRQDELGIPIAVDCVRSAAGSILAIGMFADLSL